MTVAGVTPTYANITLRKYYSPDKRHYIFNNSAIATTLGGTKDFNLTIAYNS